MKLFIQILIFTLFVGSFLNTTYASNHALTEEERGWLALRGNTLIIAPERNSPPFSFSVDSVDVEGIFIDYIGLVAQKFDLKVSSLAPRTTEEVIGLLQEGKGDYIANLGFERAERLSLLYNKPYANIPVVIAVRQDYSVDSGLTLEDFNNKRVAVLGGSTIESYIKLNYPKVIIEKTSDNELALQKIILAEVDAAVMNSESLSYFLAKQSMANIKVAGVISDLYVNPTFTVSKNQKTLNSILEKGLSQITPEEHNFIMQKWQKLPFEREEQQGVFSKLKDVFGVGALYVFSILCLVCIIIVLLFSLRKQSLYRLKKGFTIDELKQEMSSLESASKSLAEELEAIKNLEK